MSEEAIPPRTPMDSLENGLVFAGRYRAGRKLGEGGMGAVYEGEHIEIGKRVAIKFVHALHARNDEVIARFKREARSASAIESDHIVQVFDVGFDPAVGLFMIMEFLKGRDLGDFLEEVKQIEPIVACRVALQAMSGLAKAHESGIVHRDLKPANVFLCARDDGSMVVKLVDFGVAKIVRDVDKAAEQGLTRVGSAIGTAQYMSPEQAQGLPNVDGRTDMYSLGAVLYEMLVGRCLIPDYDTYEQTIIHIVTKPVPRVSASIPNIDPALDQLVWDMLNPDVNLRIQTMTQARDRLLEIYPELDGLRVFLRNVAPDQAGREPTSGIVRIVGSRAGSGGNSALSIQRARTSEGMSVEAVKTEDLNSSPVVKKSRSKVGLIAGVGLGIAATILLLFFLRNKSQAANAGLVAPPAVSAIAVAVTPLASGSTARSVVLDPIAATPPPAPAPSSTTTPRPAVNAKPIKASAKVAIPPTPAETAKSAPVKSGGQVGGTGIASEF